MLLQMTLMIRSRISTTSASPPFIATQKETITISLGDLNTNVGSDNTGYEKITGHEGLGVTNDNGGRFADMRAVNNLVI